MPTKKSPAPRGKRWKKIHASDERGLKRMLADPERYGNKRIDRAAREKKLKGGKPGFVQERLHVAGLLGTGLSVKTVAIRTGLTHDAVSQVQKQMRQETLRGEAFRKAAQEARERIQGKALDALELAIRKATEQIKRGVRGSNGKMSEAPLSHVAQAVQSLGRVALHEERGDEKPRQPDPPSTVPLTAKQIGELLMQVRDHEQAKSSREAPKELEVRGTRV